MAPRTRSTAAGGKIRSQKRVSYKEDVSSPDISDEETDGTLEDSSFDSDSVDVDTRSQPPLSRDLLAARAPLHAARSGTKTSEKNPSRSNRSMSRRKKITKAVTGRTLENQNPIIKLGGKIPPWQNLPYHTLLQIFHYACLPLMSESADVCLDSNSTAWLLQTSQLCRSFVEPALSVLYYSPPISESNAPRLIAHLASQTEDSTLNYRAKVKYLDVGPNCMASNIGELIGLTPQLRGLGVHFMNSYTPRPRPTYLSGEVKYKGVSYLPSVFHSLQIHHIALQDWIWNFLLMGNNPPESGLINIHSSSPFQSLRSLTFISFDGSGYSEEEITRAIDVLPRLERLTFKVSSVVNQKLLLLLPNQLRFFELVNCPSITSEILSLFLASHGQNLRQLILDHNRSLSLSFLADLALTCPRIEYLRVNLRFHNTHLAFQSSHPNFKSLLLLNEVPSWPASLQRLELFHLRKWSIDIAEMFFSSLVNSAASLSNLRRLEIKASLGESGWRDRIMFRDKWTDRLKDVFFRFPTPPAPHLYSISAFNKYKHLLQNSDSALPDKTIISPKLALRMGKNPQPNSKFGHIEINAGVNKNHGNDSINESKAMQAGNRRSKRIKLQVDSNQQIPPPNLVVTRRQTRRKKRSEDSSASEDSAIDDPVEKDSDDDHNNNNSKTSGRGSGGCGDEERDFHVQGMCDVVNVLIDNLRPTDMHFKESDFLDKEVSGDEDWNGDESKVTEEFTGRYAW